MTRKVSGGADSGEPGAYGPELEWSEYAGLELPVSSAATAGPERSVVSPRAQRSLMVMTVACRRGGNGGTTGIGSGWGTTSIVRICRRVVGCEGVGPDCDCTKRARGAPGTAREAEDDRNKTGSRGRQVELQAWPGEVAGQD
jgi:hypothetical protein